MKVVIKMLNSSIQLKHFSELSSTKLRGHTFSISNVRLGKNTSPFRLTKSWKKNNTVVLNNQVIS